METELPDWYKSATHGRSPAPFNITKRFGSQWYRYQPVYELALRVYASSLREQNNNKASQVIEASLLGIPKQLPYTLEITAFEWPLISSALLMGHKGFPKSSSVICWTLYRALLKAKEQ